MEGDITITIGKFVVVVPSKGKKQGKLDVPLTFNGNLTVKGDNLMTTMTSTQYAHAGPVTGKDKDGNPAVFDSAPVWSVDPTDESVVKLDVDPDGLTADILAVGLGKAQVRIDADADLGEGVRTLTSLLAFEILGGEAVSMDVPVGEPAEQADRPVVDPRSKR